MGARADEVLPYYTEKEWQEWDGSWELIEGQPYAMAPAPYVKHQEISLNIATYFKEKLRDCPMRCKTLLPVDWYVDETTIVQPDVLIVCGENIGTKKLTITPTLVVEVEGAPPIPNAKLLPAIVTVVFPAQVNVPAPETAVVLANAILSFI
jgi:hypothetical protein